MGRAEPVMPRACPTFTLAVHRGHRRGRGRRPERGRPRPRSRAPISCSAATAICVLRPPSSGARRKPWPSPFAQGIDEVLAMRGRQVCVLASGDPFHYGVGSVLAGHVAPEETAGRAGALRLQPRGGAARLGAARHRARLGAWARARPHPPALHPGARVLALTSDSEGPAALARLLAETGFGDSRLTVLEALGGARERVRTTTRRTLRLRRRGGAQHRRDRGRGIARRAHHRLHAGTGRRAVRA